MPKFEDRAVRYISDLIRDFKYEDYQAAGFPANFGVETGGFEHVQEINPIGGGRGGLGDAQWTGPRRREFEAWLARNPGWTAWDYSANYSMLFRELEGDESGAREAVRQAKDVDDATEIVMRRFERPGVEHLEKRKEYGRRALAAFRAAGIDVAALRAQGRPGVEATKEGEILPPSLPGAPQLDLGRILALLLPLIQHVLADQKLRDAVLPLLFQLLGRPADAKPDQPKPPASVNPVTKGSLLSAIAALLGGSALQLNGTVAPPIGESATLPGILTTLAPIAIAAFGGPIGGFVSRLFSGISFRKLS